MNSLPKHGIVDCSLCHMGKPVDFNRTVTSSDDAKWRILANPLAWGSQNPVVVALGFSKGGGAVAALNEPTSDFNDIPFARKRAWVAKILRKVQLLGSDSSKAVEDEIRNRNGLYHFGSLIRCTVEQRVSGDGRQGLITSGNSMLEGFSSHPFGRKVLHNCIQAHLGSLPESVKIVVMFGYGRNLGGDTKDKPDHFVYVENVRAAMQMALGEPLTKFNAVSYFNQRFVVVHVEHFAEPANATRWLDEVPNGRTRLRKMSFNAIKFALDR